MNPLKNYYEKYWSSFDGGIDTDPTTPARISNLKEALAAIPEGSKILDFGCGLGDFTDFISTLGFDVLGVDISETVINLAKIKHNNVKFHILNEDDRIPAPANHFSAVWSSEVIEHIFDVNAHLKEIHRVLKPNGVYILTTPFHGRLKNSLITLLKFNKHFNPEGEHIRFFDKSGLKLCLEKAGFEPFLWKGIGRIPPLYRTLFVMAKKVSIPFWQTEKPTDVSNRSGGK